MSSQTSYLHQDFWSLCHLRFEHWYRCNYNFRSSYSDYIKRGEKYPCSSLWYEMKSACSDDMIEYLLEMGNVRMANNYHPKDYMSNDVKTAPLKWDLPEYQTESRDLKY